MQVFLLVYSVIMIIMSIIIIVSILLQEDKSGGGIGIIGGSSQSFFGASSNTLLSKFTSILLTIFLISGIIIAIICARFTNETTISEKDISKAEYEAKKTTIETNNFLNKIDNTTDDSSKKMNQ